MTFDFATAVERASRWPRSPRITYAVTLQVSRLWLTGVGKENESAPDLDQGIGPQVCADFQSIAGVTWRSAACGRRARAGRRSQ